MDDRDLQLLRSLGRDDAEPTAELRDHIHEQVWQAILEEEAAASRPIARHAARRWYRQLGRPAIAFGAAVTVAIGVTVMDDGRSPVTAPSGSGAQQAGVGVLSTTAATLFGDADAAAASGIDGTIDMSDGRSHTTLAAGPVHDSSTGVLDARSARFAQTAPRDPARLRDALRAAVGTDPGDRAAFRVAMAWIVDPAVPTDVRAAMLRSLEGISGIDDALSATDLLGRPGIVLGHFDTTSGMRDQYLLDPRGGRLLERRSTVAHYVDPACPPGTVTGHALYSDSGDIVAQHDAPWIAWPQVVTACEPA